MSTTDEPYVTFRPFGISGLRMDQIVFVFYNLLISFAVDLIHLILCFNLVMSSWGLRDFPVSGQMTALAISGKIITSVSALRLCVYFVWAEIEKIMICLCHSFGQHILGHNLLSCTSLHHNMRCLWCDYYSDRCLLPAMRIWC
jgi:hypothetical protein